MYRWLWANLIQWFIGSDRILAIYCFVTLMGNWLLSSAIQKEAMESGILPEEVAQVAEVMGI